MLKQKIRNDLTKATKGGDEVVISTLRMLLAVVLNREKERKYKERIEGEVELTDEEMFEIISSEIKKRKEAIFGYKQGKRADLVKKEEAEMSILQQYLPEQLSEEEIRKLAQRTIKKVGAKEMRDMGKVMAEIMSEVKGRADGGLVSKIVKELLTPKEQD
ncbi:MAG: GatB/YqeY domain-containing protein [Candidatus Nealsonbacteria bacterium]|nr:GatB/YqeY domain-containing protein [Candidatus Nealsonbacteria bacterium]